MEIDTLLAFKPEMMSSSAQALEVLYQVWELENRPKESASLIRVLKLTLDRCQREGIVYPRIFLLRKAQLQRGEFQPSIAGRAMRFIGEGHSKVPQEWIDAAVKEFHLRPARREGSEKVLGDEAVTQ